MTTIPQRIASAFAVLCGRYGDVTQMAKDRERSRQALYREAQQVAEAVDGAVAQAQIEDLQRQLAARQAAWHPRPVTCRRGFLSLFLNEVTQADEGCDFGFLHAEVPLPEPEIH